VAPGFRVDPEEIPEIVIDDGCCNGKGIGQDTIPAQDVVKQVKDAKINDGTNDTYDAEFEETHQLLAFFLG
jgi:hypothetical protein